MEADRVKHLSYGFQSVGFLTIVLASVLPAHAETALPYALEGIRLGTPLSELRQLLFLDQDLRKESRLICSIDPEAATIDELHPDDPLPPQMARCGIYRRDDSREWQSARIGILGEQVDPILMIRTGDQHHEPHLMELIARLNNGRFQEVLTLLKRTYGTPTSFEMSSINTLYGPLSNATYVWNNEFGSIKVDMLTVDLERMSIQLTEQVKKLSP